MNKQLKAILKNTLDDIRSDDRLDHAAMTLDCAADTLIMAGCPEQIINAMKDTLPLSKIERVYCCKQIEAAIKKSPH